MLDEIKNIKSEKSDFKKFGITIGVTLLFIAGLLFLLEKENFCIFAILGLTLISFGVIYPIILKPIYLVWMTFATILGWFMTRFILSLLFYFIISTIGLILRMFGKEFLNIDYNSKNSSYWNNRNSIIEKNQYYEKQF